MKKTFLYSFPLLILLLPMDAQGSITVFSANQEISGPPRWNNVPNVYLDDDLYAIDTCSSNKLDTFTVGLADPVDTLNKLITKVTIYAKARTHYPKAMFWLWPVYNDRGYRSGNLKIGTTETLFSFDITPQDTALADSTWNWDDIRDLAIRYQARTSKVIYFVNHIFAAVTYIDTLNVEQTHRFHIDPIASPETVGVYFPLSITVLDSLGGPLTSYNGSALISDLTGTSSPMLVSFTNSIGSIAVAVNDTFRNNYIVVDDGTARDSSNLFDVVNTGLHHFSIDSIGTQTKDVPFGVTITAMDFFDDPVISFSGQADLWDRTDTLTPDSASPFAAGIWSGSISIGSGCPLDTVFCSYYSGNLISGSSNGFAVQDPSGICTDPPGSVLPGVLALRITPNPTSGRSRFSLDLPWPGRVEIILYNILGQVASRKELGGLASGRTELDWNIAAANPQGLYFVRAIFEGKTTVFRKLLIMK